MLNARRHRGGDHQVSAWRVALAIRCAQRPEASGRRSLEVLRAVVGNLEVLNARRHRGGDHPEADRGVDRQGIVLNARRHRGGDHELRERPTLPRFWCSTPGGIGAAITLTCPARPPDRPGCAQRPEASGRRSPYRTRHSESSERCSTPGGIGAAITWTIRSRAAPRASRAQRPEASGRRSRGWARDRDAQWSLVLNARRHRGGDHSAPYANPVWASLCSTPGGIGAAIT